MSVNRVTGVQEMLGMATTEKRKFASSSGGGPAKKPKLEGNASSQFEADLADMEEGLDLEEEFDAEMAEACLQADSLSDSQRDPSPSPSAGPTASQKPRWARPPAAKLDTRNEALTFLHLELDCYVASSSMPGMPGPSQGPAAVMRMFGMTADENSVCVHVHGFAPYLYIPAPEGGLADGEAEEFRSKLNTALLNDMRSNKQQVSLACLAVEPVEKENIYGYHGNRKIPFLKVTVALPKLVAPAKRLLELGNIGTSRHSPQPYQTFESNVDFEVRFMVDADVVGCSWIELPAQKYKLRSTLNKDFPPLTRWVWNQSVLLAKFLLLSLHGSKPPPKNTLLKKTFLQP